jgi:UDP-N-acetylmuramate--alanine ligase
VSELNKLRKIYFIGIGGIGMSALARYFNQKGCEVAGYDRTRTALTLQLEASGITIHYEDNIELIPKDADAIVYTPAIPASHTELLYYLENGYQVVKRSEVLRWITEASFNICIAGTHGKTTISTMVAHILRHSGYGCNAFLGGISANYHSNFWSNENNVVVVEADEYDRSFLKLVPDIAVITAMDADHLDIYGTEKEVEDSFIQFSKKIKTNGVLISKYGLKRKRELNASKQFTYSLDNENASVFAKNIKVENGHYVFDIQANGWELIDVQLNMGGLHNIENSIAAIAVARLLKINPEKIKAAVNEFKGVKRRFEYWLNNEDHVLIDDYAHHPEELRALITGVRSLYGSEKITIIFQPHLFSRTRDFAKEFAASLDLADEVILLPIYPARELPIGGVTSELILQKMKLEKKYFLSKEALLLWMQQNKPKIVVMAGAGDIDTVLIRVKEILMNK